MSAIENLDDAVTSSVRAFSAHRKASSESRAILLRALGSELEGSGHELISIARSETRLGEARLAGEFARTLKQIELFATVVEEGSFEEIILEDADPATSSPSLRRMLVPLGPVAVFGASNFPFAFGVVGNDTMSALAAGCSVVHKINPGHPELGRLTARIAQRALLNLGVDDGLLVAIEGDRNVSQALVRHSSITAVGFTGSTLVGRALFDLASSRPYPVPFYGELGSVNPVFVTRKAVVERWPEIAEGFVASFTQSSGQLCTKPGLLAYQGPSELATSINTALLHVPGGPLLNDRISTQYRATAAELASLDGVQGMLGPRDDDVERPLALIVAAADVLANPSAYIRECFGPLSVVVHCRSKDEMLLLAEAFEGQLAAAVHGGDTGDEDVEILVDKIAPKVGRVIYNGWPTGVAVSWAMQHGGPYPASTNSLHTSVGPTAIRRFLRPITFQSFPSSLLPAQLSDSPPQNLPRRINGVLHGV